MYHATSSNFNTSHVNVNREETLQARINTEISIHLMLMLIESAGNTGIRGSVISIHLMLMLIWYN